MNQWMKYSPLSLSFLSDFQINILQKWKKETTQLLGELNFRIWKERKTQEKTASLNYLRLYINYIRIYKMYEWTALSILQCVLISVVSRYFHAWLAGSKVGICPSGLATECFSGNVYDYILSGPEIICVHLDIVSVGFHGWLMVYSCLLNQEAMVVEIVYPH